MNLLVRIPAQQRQVGKDNQLQQTGPNHNATRALGPSDRSATPQAHPYLIGATEALPQAQSLPNDTPKRSREKPTYTFNHQHVAPLLPAKTQIPRSKIWISHDTSLQKKSLKDMELLNVIENTSMFLKEFQRNTM